MCEEILAIRFQVAEISFIGSNPRGEDEQEMVLTLRNDFAMLLVENIAEAESVDSSIVHVMVFNGGDVDITNKHGCEDHMDSLFLCEEESGRRVPPTNIKS
jgi:hypothetical protein